MGTAITSQIKVVELFAGVGGFRIGLENEIFKFVFSNQWEPSDGRQWASKIYETRFITKEHTNEDIHTVTKIIPEHDLLVGGFPCQDYSVARTISGEMGIEGEKGKLWTPIKEIIRDAKIRPKLVFLENVPRLLNSPSKHRGLNFAVIVNDFMTMGYDVEWRVIKASEYGMPQQRRRIFIIAYRRPTNNSYYRNGPERFGPKSRCSGPMKKWLTGKSKPENLHWDEGPLSKAFPIIGEIGKKREFPGISEFTWNSKSSPFSKSGYAWKDNKRNSWLYSFNSTPVFEGVYQTLGDILVDDFDLDFVISDEEKLRMYAYIKGEQKEWRIRKSERYLAEKIIDNHDSSLWDLYQNCTKSYDTEKWRKSRLDSRYKIGLEDELIYNYTAGAMAFPDSLDKASRTIVTAEIGRSVSRMRHVIEYEKGKFRRLMPIELERLNQFPDNWTNIEGITDSKRGFLMGNALVVGVVKRLSGPLAELIRDGVNNDA